MLKPDHHILVYLGRLTAHIQKMLSSWTGIKTAFQHVSWLKKL